MTALLGAPNGLVRLSGLLTVCPIVPYLITLPINRLGLTCALVNRRKEFFNVSLKEIKIAVYELAGNDVDFIETVVAQQCTDQRGASQQRRSIGKIYTITVCIIGRKVCKV